MLAILVGLAFGTLQLAVLAALVKAISGGDATRVFLLAVAKLVLWGAFFAALAVFFRFAILPAGCGAAAAMVLGGFAGFAVLQRKNRAEKKEQKQ